MLWNVVLTRLTKSEQTISHWRIWLVCLGFESYQHAFPYHLLDITNRVAFIMNLFIYLLTYFLFIFERYLLREDKSTQTLFFLLRCIMLHFIVLNYPQDIFSSKCTNVFWFSCDLFQLSHHLLFNCSPCIYKYVLYIYEPPSHLIFCSLRLNI